LGVISIQIKKSPENRIQQLQSNSQEIIFSITDVLKETTYYNRYYANIIEVGSINTKGKIVVRIEKDSTQEQLSVGSVIITKTMLDSLNPVMNPYAFDYKSYLKQNNIYEQLLLRKRTWKKLPQTVFSLQKIAFEFREKLIHSLGQRIKNKDVLAITVALILGERHYVSKELQRNYANAGVIHILAVSGLHIGIIVLLLHFLLQPLKRFKYGSLVMFLLIVFFLWAYAFVAGLSASVVRAVTMFSFVSLGIVMKNKTNVFYALITSALVLLLCNPYFLFSLGFKMSYIAVISIVVLQPLLSGFWKTKYKITTYFWNLVTVSIAAQIGLLPLSLYYFHQFPGLFVLSNLVIIPCLSLVLVSGFLVLLISLSRFQFSLLLDMYTGLVNSLNRFIAFISEQEAWLFSEIYFSILQMAAFYILIISGVFLLTRRSIQRIYLFLCAIVLVQVVFLYELKIKNELQEFIVYQQYKSSLISVTDQGSISSYGAKNTYANKIIQTYATGIGMPIIREIKKPPSLYRFKESIILVIDSLGFYRLPEFKNQIIIMQNSPKINLERYIQYIQPKLIIADGSNYPYKKEKWKLTCKKMNVPYYDTSTRGAFILK
jgi:competence protein ComEC